MRVESYATKCPECHGVRYISTNLLCPICNGVGQIVIPDGRKPGLSRAKLRNALIGCALMLAVIAWLALR